MNKHLQPSGINSNFRGQGLSFANYILNMQDIIRQARIDLDSPIKDTILQANSPQEFIPQGKPSYGVLLIHGLLDSPYVMHDLFEVFKGDNALVRSVVLPGHGTVPGDLCQVTLEAWRECVAQGIAWMKQDVDRLVLVGFSTGASLALEYTLKNHSDVLLILIAPAFRILNILSPWTGVINSFGNYISAAKWVHHCFENDYAKYRSLAMNGVYQVQRLTNDLAKLTEQTSCHVPTFILGSFDDEIVSVTAMQEYLLKKTNPQSQLWLYGEPKKRIADPRITYRTSHYPELRILDFSHISLVNAPNNPHYGQNGDFSDLGHYQTWWGKALTKITSKNESYLGALTSHNLRHHVIQRLTYNPDFANMSAQMLLFVHTHLTTSTQDQASMQTTLRG